MNPRQRQQRIEAAAKAFGTLPLPGVSTLDFPERIARALDAADRAVPLPVVTDSQAVALVKQLGVTSAAKESGLAAALSAGVAIAVVERDSCLDRVKRAEAAAREFGELLKHVEQTLNAGTWLDMAPLLSVHDIRHALAKHSEFVRRQ